MLFSYLFRSKFSIDKIHKHFFIDEQNEIKRRKKSIEFTFLFITSPLQKHLILKRKLFVFLLKRKSREIFIK